MRGRVHSAVADEAHQDDLQELFITVVDIVEYPQLFQGLFAQVLRLVARTLTDGVKAFMPPQGLLLISAYLPEHWQVRFIGGFTAGDHARLA